MNTEQQILQKLEKIESDIQDIREHMVDADAILTEEERKLLDESIKHEKEGSLASLQ